MGEELQNLHATRSYITSDISKIRKRLRQNRKLIASISLFVHVTFNKSTLCYDFLLKFLSTEKSLRIACCLSAQVTPMNRYFLWSVQVSLLSIILLLARTNLDLVYIEPGFSNLLLLITSVNCTLGAPLLFSCYVLWKYNEYNMILPIGVSLLLNILNIRSFIVHSKCSYSTFVISYDNGIVNLFIGLLLFVLQ